MSDFDESWDYNQIKWILHNIKRLTRMDLTRTNSHLWLLLCDRWAHYIPACMNFYMHYTEKAKLTLTPQALCCRCLQCLSTDDHMFLCNAEKCCLPRAKWIGCNYVWIKIWGLKPFGQMPESLLHLLFFKQVTLFSKSLCHVTHWCGHGLAGDLMTSQGAGLCVGRCLGQEEEGKNGSFSFIFRRRLKSWKCGNLQ